MPLTITEPADGATLTSNAISVKGQTAPGANVSVNDQAFLADKDGNFAVNLNLESGPNTIDVVASDDSGNSQESLLIVDVNSGT